MSHLVRLAMQFFCEFQRRYRFSSVQLGFAEARRLYQLAETPEAPSIAEEPENSEKPRNENYENFHAARVMTEFEGNVWGTHFKKDPSGNWQEALTQKQSASILTIDIRKKQKETKTGL